MGNVSDKVVENQNTFYVQ